MNLKKTETLVKAIAPVIRQFCHDTYEKRSQELYREIKSDIEVMWLDYVEFKSEKNPAISEDEILAITRKEMENFELDVPAEAFDESKNFVIDYVNALKDELDG